MELHPCSRCKRSLPSECFNRDSRRPSGLQRYCKDCKREHNQTRWPDYKHRPEWKKSHREACLRYEERHPEIAAAHRAVKKAIRQGVLPPPRCALRGTPGHECGGHVEYHHDDYSRPLEVRGLCKRGHEDEHHPSRFNVPTPIPNEVAA